MGEGQDVNVERAGHRLRQESRRLQGGSEDDVLASLRSEDIMSSTPTEVTSQSAKLRQSESYCSTKENLRKSPALHRHSGCKIFGFEQCSVFP